MTPTATVGRMLASRCSASKSSFVIHLTLSPPLVYIGRTMTLLYRDPRFLDHETGSHPERALRLRTVESHLDRTWLAAQCRQITAEPCDRACLALVHKPAYIEEIWAFAGSGAGILMPTRSAGRAALTLPRWPPELWSTRSAAWWAGKIRPHSASSGRQDTMLWPARRWVFAFSTTWPWERRRQ